MKQQQAWEESTKKQAEEWMKQQQAWEESTKKQAEEVRKQQQASEEFKKKQEEQGMKQREAWEKFQKEQAEGRKPEVSEEMPRQPLPPPVPAWSTGLQPYDPQLANPLPPEMSQNRYGYWSW